MDSHRLALFVLFLVAGACSGAAYGQFEAPNKAELDIKSDPKAPGAAAVYLDRVETADDPHHFETIYARIKVLTDDGKKAATVRIANPATFVFHASGDNSSRMQDGSNHWDAPDVNHSGEDRPNDLDHYEVKLDVSALQGRTIHPDGTIVPLPQGALKKSGQNEFSFTLPDPQVGSVLEYRYQIRYDRYEGAPDWQIQKDYFTRHAHFSFTPDERFSQFRNRTGSAGIQDSALRDSHGEQMTDIRSGTILPPGTTVRAEAMGGYSLDMIDIPAFPSEPYSTPAEGQAYRVSFFYVPTPDEKEFWQKQMSFWTRGLERYIAPTSMLQNLVKEITASATTPADKAQKLYEYTQKTKNTDFGLDGEPGTGSDTIPAGRVEKVITDERGTSNQLAYLYLAMARIAGLNARPERIASRSKRIFSPQFRQTSQLDTVVIALNLDGKEVIVDPGVPMAPFGTLHWAHSAASGLAMNNGKVETIVTPAQRGTDNEVVHVGSLNVSQNGEISGTIKVAFVGQEALRLRQIRLRSGADAVAEELNRTLLGQMPEGIIAKLDHLTYLNEPGKQLLAVMAVSGPLKREDGRFVVPRSLFHARSQNPFPEAKERKLTIDVQYPEVSQEKITYVLPAGFGLSAKPEQAKINGEALGYTSSVTADKNSITVARVFARGFTLLEPEKYGPLHEFYDKVIAADRQQLLIAPGAHASNAQ